MSTQIHPERQQRVAKSLKFYTFTAILTGIWLLILVAEMVYQYLILGSARAHEMPEWMSLIGPIHGGVFMVYVVACLDLGTKARWEPVKWLTTMLAGVVPLLSFVVERKRREEVKAEFQLN